MTTLTRTHIMVTYTHVQQKMYYIIIKIIYAHRHTDTHVTNYNVVLQFGFYKVQEFQRRV